MQDRGGRRQKETFLESEGDEWYRRHRDAFTAAEESDDRVMAALQACAVRPRRVLEIGCTNGFRLSWIRSRLGADCHGIDPSALAIAEGRARWPELSLQVGTADALSLPDDTFDTIIFGFCLYLCDRSDLFRIASEADRCLQDQGTIIISDFCPPFPYRNRYRSRPGVHSYKMDHSRLFAWNPAYVEVYRRLFGHPEAGSGADFLEAVIVLRKELEQGYPLEPFGPTAERRE
jgi:SAM-dependent methyltransferase